MIRSLICSFIYIDYFFFQAEDGIRDYKVTGVQTCALPIFDILTPQAFENALTMIMAVGGSTNAVLHLIAIAKAARVPLSLQDFQKASDRVPLLADLKPSGRFVQEDLHGVGGTPAVMKYLLEKGYLHGGCMTVTGKTLAEN